MAWIEVHQGLREHRKTYACAEKLKISRVVMVGTLVSLWLWALDNAPDGSMDGVSNRTIAHVCDWPEKKAETLINSLVECGWLDKDGDILRIHDWTDYAGRLMERRENDKARKKKSREKQRMSAGCPQDVHGKSCATVPIPYPNHTVPIYGGDGESAGAREASESDLERIGLKPGEYPMVTVSLVDQVEKLTDILIQRHANRRYTPIDCRNVFQYAFRWENGGFVLCEDTFGLLEYSFEQAAISGFIDNWRYIYGIMGRLAARDIYTRAEAEAFDAERQDKEAAT